MTQKITHVTKRDGRVVPYERNQVANAIYKAAASVGGRDKALAASLAAEVERLLFANYEPGATPTVEDIQDLVEKVLIEDGHARTSKAYILYRYRRSQIRADVGKRDSGRAVEVIPWRLLWSTLAWNADHDCDRIERLNEIIRDGRFPDLVREAEDCYERQLDWAADVAMEKEDMRVLIVAGPSSSGKTTTTTKLAQRLKTRGLELVALNLDNYFRDLECHPKDEYGDYDYETPEALDLPLINQHLEALIKGEEILMPKYDFHTGKQILDQTPMRINDNQILLLDTLHGLFDGLTRVVPDEQKFKLYIETFCQLRPRNGRFVRWTDVRLLRRMVRDANFRNHDPALTLGHWHYVRRSEMKHIIPFQHTVDFIVNGAVPYELPVLKKHVWPYFAGLVEQYEKQPERQDAIIRGRRVLDILSQLEAVSDKDEASIPGDALIREFIGGSTLSY